MWFFRYTSFLEEQNRVLNKKITDLEARNQELVVQILSKINFSVLASDKEPEPKHLMKKGEKRAECSCGWVYASDDPGKLQTAIVGHYREVPANRGRKSWPQARTALENVNEEKK